MGDFLLAATGTTATVEAASGWPASITDMVYVMSGWVWGMPLIGAVLATGLLLTLCLRLAHIFNLGRAFRYMFGREEGEGVSGEVSSLAALCTALSAMIGTGNIVGVRRQWCVKIYRVLYVAVVFVGPYLTVSVVWGVADVLNGLMAFPNLVALVLLSPVVVRTTRDFLHR